jgi:hypothetical protein
LDGFVTFIAPRESDSTTYPAGIGLRVEELSSRTESLEEITRVQIENLTQCYPDCDLIESSATTLAGNPAHKIEFTATYDKEEKRKAIQIWTLKDDKAYLFTYKADPKTIQLTCRQFKVCFSHLKLLNKTKKTSNSKNYTS